MLIFLFLSNKNVVINLQKKATQTVMFIVLFYVICWLPNQITHFMYFLQFKDYIRKLLFNYYILNLLSNILHPCTRFILNDYTNNFLKT